MAKTNSKQRPGVMLYFDLFHCMEGLCDADRGCLVSAFVRYAEDGLDPELPAHLQLIWPFLVQSADRDAEAYAEKRRQRRYATYCRGVGEESRLSYEQWCAAENDSVQPLPTTESATESESTAESTATAATESTAESAAKAKPTSAAATEPKAESAAGPGSRGGRRTPTLSPRRASDLVLGYALSPEVERRVFTWLDYKHERGEDYKEASLRALLDQLRRAEESYGYAPLCRLMEQCMASGWKNIVLSRLEREAPGHSGGNPFA